MAHENDLRRSKRQSAQTRRRSSRIANLYSTASSSHQRCSLMNKGKLSRRISQQNSRNKYKGVQRTKSGKYGSLIWDPFKRRCVWLGTFDTAEEASEMYVSKKTEFEEKLKAKRGIESFPCSEKSTPQESPCSVLEEIVSIETSQSSLNGNKEKFMDQVDFMRESEMYVSKKAAFEEKLKAKQGIESFPWGDKSTSQESPCSVLEEEKSFKVSGDQESEFGVLFGVRIIDNHGFLLGEFSKLDDLSICSMEDDMIPDHVY